MQDPTFVHQAFADIAPRYVLTNHVCSLGIDILWRNEVARLVAQSSPRDILDVATGSGDLAATIQARCPDARVVGTDFCAPMLEHARKRGLEHLLVADALDLPFADGSFDVVTVAFGLRNMADYGAALREMARVLRLGGRLLILDFSLPSPALRPFYRFYLHKIIPRIAGWITGQRGAYEYLGGSIEAFPSGQAMTDLILANGFATADHRPLTFGVASIYEAVKGG